MFQRLDNRVCHYALLLLVGLLMFGVNLGGPNLWDVDEGRNVTAALEMMAAGEWVKPTFNGELREHKPVLLYWLQIFSFRLFGINEFAARLPSALAALLTLLLVYELGRALFNRFTGLLSGLAVATTLMLGAAARFANQDALLNLFTVLTFCLFWWGFSRTGKYPYFLLGLATGLAVLAKGPVGIILPSAALVLFLLWIRQLRILFTPRILLGVISFSVVALPWYILIAVETKGEFLHSFFFRHNVERFLSPMEHHGGSFSYYLIVILAGFAPWSAFIGLTLWYGFWSTLRSPAGIFRPWWNHARDTDFDPMPATGAANQATAARYRFLFAWAGVYFLFFTIAATKLPNYILPLTTPLAILTARFLDRWRAGTVSIPALGFGAGLLAFGLVGTITIAALLVASGGLVIQGIRTPTFAGLEQWAWLGLVPVAGAILGGWFWYRHNRRAVVASLALSAVLFVGPIGAWLVEYFDQYKPPRELVVQADVLQPYRDIRVVGYQVDHLPSLHFYCQRGITHCTSADKALAQLHHAIPVYLFIPTAEWEQLKTRVQVPCRVLARHPDLHKRVAEVTVVTNQNPVPRIAAGGMAK